MPEDIKKAAEAAANAENHLAGREDKPSDEKILAAVTQCFITKQTKPAPGWVLRRSLKQLLALWTMMPLIKNGAKDVFTNTMIFDSVKWNAFIANPDANVLQADPAFSFASAFVKNYTGKYSTLYSAFVSKNNELGQAYMKGIMEMNPTAAAKMYPDANFSMRVSYGNVKSYSPRDAVKYDYVTTSRGVLEKYIPGDYEFDLPKKEIELFKNKDFGQYIDKKRNDLVIGFITTNDITGGNSGSPVMDAYGNLIGLAFDGNYEALSHKIAFDKDLNRTINVDIRYVLWCIDKLGGAKILSTN
ncbi:MAG: S46 family peptidase [Chitinophagaceae bacterium]|nr:S46 family peptidase [Chitinophagaceae bacterium]